ncbi:unnamed protein product, partial [Iphiclides podalirius]
MHHGKSVYTNYKNNYTNKIPSVRHPNAADARTRVQSPFKTDVRSPSLNQSEWTAARGERGRGVRGARGGYRTAERSGYIDSGGHVAAALVHPQPSRSSHVAAIDATAGALARPAEIMTFGPSAGEVGSARPLVPDRALATVTRHWEVDGPAPAARLRCTKELLIISPFGLL